MTNIPLFKDKYFGISISTVGKLLEYKRSLGLIPNFKMPQTILIGYQDALENHVIKHTKNKKYDFFRSNFYLINISSKTLGFVSKFGVGAPAISVILEELIFLGATKFITIGTAGAIQKSLRMGNIVICNKAFSDDGVTRHYLRNTFITFPNSEFTQEITDILEKDNEKISFGPTWTIDAPFMETDMELDFFSKKGVLTVEMEASAVFAVCKARNVSSACVFVISDTLSSEWKPDFNSTYLDRKLCKTFDTIISKVDTLHNF